MPALLERPKMTRAMYEALKRHIIREREKKKQEQEQDAMMERLKKERELRKKKEEEDHLTLEETKEQILQLEKKLEILKAQKHELFSQLKKVLHQDEKRKAQQKEESELTLPQPTYNHPPQLATAPQPMMMHGRPALYKPTATAHILTGMKRQRSPTPPPSSTSTSYSGYGHSDPKYPHTADSKYSHSDTKFSSHAETKFGHADSKYLASFAGAKAGPPSHLYTAQHAQAADFKPTAYQQATTNQLYANPSFQQQQAAAAVATSYPSSQAGGSKYPGPPGQSAFTSYQSHYAQAHPQKALPEQFPAAYPIQRMQQPGARSGYHANLQLQQTLEHPVQKPAGFDEKYKMGQSQIRGLVPPPQQPSLALLQQHQQQQQAKSSGAFVPGYPPRTQGGPAGVSYPTSTSANYSTNPSTVQGRPTYGSQPHGRYYQ